MMLRLQCLLKVPKLSSLFKKASGARKDKSAKEKLNVENFQVAGIGRLKSPYRKKNCILLLRIL